MEGDDSMEEQSPYQAPRQFDLSNSPITRPGTSAVSWFCAAYYGIALMAGARGAIVPGRSAGDLVFQAALAICLGTWAIVDARERRRPIPRSQRLWFFVFSMIVVPGYVVVTRGWSGLGWVLIHAVLWLVLYTAAMIFTGAALAVSGSLKAAGT